MSLSEKIEKDIVVAMKAREEHRLTTLRMVKSSLKNKQIAKRAPLDDAEEAQILTTLIKQRRESVESFTQGGRLELAQKEQTEIAMIEAYLPQAATEEQIREVVDAALKGLAPSAGQSKLGPKDMGPAMRVVQQHLLASGIRADGALVSRLVKDELNK
jgi:uncharacterized protein YqeY